MRLIDADAFEKTLESAEIKARQDRKYVLESAINTIRGNLRNVPSAQPTLTCDGCRHVGTYDTEFPCNGCIRMEKDYYETDR